MGLPHWKSSIKQWQALATSVPNVKFLEFSTQKTTNHTSRDVSNFKFVIIQF